MKNVVAKVFICFVILFQFLSTSTHAEDQRESRDLLEIVDEFMQRNLEEQHVPGAVLTVVQGDKVMLNKGYGFADVERRIPMDPDGTILRVGSISKIMTVIAAMQLYEEGRIDLQENVGSYTKASILNPFKKSVTIEHLMTHTGGFDERSAGKLVKNAASQITLAEYIENELPPVVREPGKMQVYDNAGMELLGYIVEEMSGKSFFEYIDQNILGPLNMTDSSFRLTDRRKRSLEQGYTSAGLPYPFYDFKATDSPSGGLTTTGADMSIFIRSILSGADRVLKKETFDLLLEHHFPKDPSVPGIAYGFQEGFWNQVRILGHNGDMDGFHSGLWIIPEKQLGIFIHGNSDSMSRMRNLFYDQVMTALIGERQDQSKRESPAANDQLNARAGTYRYPRYSHGTFEKLSLLVNSKDIDINATREGTLVTGIGIGDQFAPIGTVYRDSIGNVMQFDSNGKTMQFYSPETGSMSLIKIPWYEKSSYHLYFLLGSVLLFLLMAIREIVSLVSKNAGDSKLISSLLLIINVQHIVFILGIAYILSNTFEFNFGTPILFNILLLIPFFTISLLAVTIFLVVKVGKHGRSPRYVYMIASLFFYIIFYVVLDYWNLLGYK
jgi:CubicO group peptidase (beta-lactamase class C family)